MEAAPYRMEHRYGTRVELNLLVSLLTAEDNIHHARILDASISGALVHARVRLPLLTTVAVRPLVPRPNLPRELEACVVRTDGYRAGLEWLDPEPAVVRALLFVRDDRIGCATRPRGASVYEVTRAWRYAGHHLHAPDPRR